MNRGAVAALALVLLAVPAQGATDRVLTISTASAGPATAFQAFDAQSVKLFDFDGDGVQEIVAHNDNRRVYVFDSQNGALRAELTTTYPSGWGARPINAPEAAVLTPGGAPHLVIANSAASIDVFRFDGESGGDFVFTKIWDRRLDDCYGNPGMDAKPVLHDLDGDGDLEILGATEEVGFYALHHDGSLMWKKCIGGGNAAPAVGDIDFDGVPEVVWASDGGVVSVTNGMTGSTRWSFWAGAYGLGAASIPVGPAIGQIDGVGPLDVVFGARDSHDAEDFSNNHAALFAVSGWGGLLWMRQDPGGAPLTYTRPVIVDIDGDGENDVFWGDWNTVGHKPPFPGDTDPAPWESTGGAHLYRYDADGDLRWRQTLDTYWSNKEIVIGDVDGDGRQEVLGNGAANHVDGIWYLDAVNGNLEQHHSVHPWKVSRAPVLGDLWDSGTMQWVVPVSAADGSVSGGAILVYDTHQPYNAYWPHQPYPSAADGPGGGGGTFPATFTLSGSVNEWWVDVKVTSPHSVTFVSARVDGGPDVTLSKTSWGTWAKSFHVPTGSDVVFTAVNAAGDTAVSETFTWLGDPPDPPPPGDLNATFSVPGSVNNWWVEVDVDATNPLTTVTASVDGGGEVQLTKRSWGNWANSFYVPTGAEVVFRASDGSATVVSEPITWLGPPPDPGNISATFKLGDVNQWWVDVKVTGAGTVTGVDAIVDDGTPVALGKTSWGTWAKSFYVPAGSNVRFEATDGIDTAVSDDFTWLVSGGPFEATFTTGDTANNWWVEVDVSATQVVTAVEATVDGGAPIALPKTSWGTWAKSFYVADGATVVFRATDGTDTVESSPVVWG